DAQTGQEIRTLKVNIAFFGGVAFSPDGKRFAGCIAVSGRSAGLPVGPGEVKVWDAQTGQELLAVKGVTRTMESMVFSPDGKRLAGGDMFYKTVKVWDAQTGEELFAFKADVQSMAFSPDGHRLVSSSNDGPVTIWDATPLPAKP